MQETTKRKRDTAPEAAVLPLVALRGVVPYPHLALDFEVGRAESQHAVDAALSADRRILLVAQRDQAILRPAPSDLYSVGVVAEIQQVMRARSSMRVLVTCASRAELHSFLEPGGKKNDYWRAAYTELPEAGTDGISPVSLRAAMNLLRRAYLEYCRVAHRYPREFSDLVSSPENASALFESIWANVDCDYHVRQAILECDLLTLRMEYLTAELQTQIQILEAEQDIQDRLTQRADANQREMFLREQLQVISEELGDTAGGVSDVQRYLAQIEALRCDEETREKLRREANQLNRMPTGSQEAYVISNYLESVLALPWGKFSREKTDIAKAEALLERDHYGLKRVKERVLEAMSVHVLQPEQTGQIICLVGPPGVGKTSIAKSVAKALGRSYVRVSLGGIRD